MNQLTFPHFARYTALLVLVGAGSAWAQSTENCSEPFAPCAIADGTEETENSNYLRRILELQDGSFVRTACLLQNGKWMLGKKASSRSIPDSLVVSVVQEATLLEELRNQAKSCAPGTLPAWCLQRGLLKEGFARLDENLNSHGLRKEALEDLADYAHYLPTPPTVQEGVQPDRMFAELAKWLADKNTTSLHELTAQSLAQAAQDQSRTRTSDEVDPWDLCLTQVLKGSKARQRDLALSTLAQWKGPRSGYILRRFALLDSAESTRNHSARLLGTLNDPKQIYGLAGWLEHENQIVKSRAATALGWSGYPAAVPALVAALGNGASDVPRVPHANIFIGSQTAYVQDYDVEIANGSSIADPVVNMLPAGVVLDVAVVSIAVHRTVYHKALSRITGHRPGTTAKAWMRWLQEYPTVDTDWRAPWPLPHAGN